MHRADAPRSCIVDTPTICKPAHGNILPVIVLLLHGLRCLAFCWLRLELPGSSRNICRWVVDMLPVMRSVLGIHKTDKA